MSPRSKKQSARSKEICGIFETLGIDSPAKREEVLSRGRPFQIEKEKESHIELKLANSSED